MLSRDLWKRITLVFLPSRSQQRREQIKNEKMKINEKDERERKKKKKKKRVVGEVGEENIERSKCCMFPIKKCTHSYLSRN